jgi:hypothetical protein
MEAGGGGAVYDVCAHRRPRGRPLGPVPSMGWKRGTETKDVSCFYHMFLHLMLGRGRCCFPGPISLLTPRVGSGITVNSKP